MITFKVTPDDGESYVLRAGSRDVYHWERTHKGRSFADLGEPKMTVLYELAHHTAKRAGRFEGDLGAFIDTHDIQPIEEEEPDPTQSAASADD